MQTRHLVPTHEAVYTHLNHDHVTQPAALMGRPGVASKIPRTGILWLLLLALGLSSFTASAQVLTNYYPYIYSRWTNPTNHYEVKVTSCSLLCFDTVLNAQAVANTNLNDFAVASVTGLSLLGAQRKIAWADLESTAAAGDYAGFVIGGLDLVQVSLLNNSAIRTYLNGAVKESRFISTLINIDLLAGGRVAIAFKTTNAFNRVEIDFGGGLLDLSVFNGTTFYYAFAGQPFAPPNANDDAFTLTQCSQNLNVLANDVAVGGTLDPASVRVIANPTKGTAVVQGDGTILYTGNDGAFGTDSFSYQVCHALPPVSPPRTSQFADPTGHYNSGTAGICLGCNVFNASNVADSNANSYASLVVPVGLLTDRVWISADLTAAAGAGDCAGFIIGTSDGLLDVSLLDAFRLTTYLDGNQQEQSGTGVLLNLSLLFLGGGKYELRFPTTKAFDRVRIDFYSVASVFQNWRAYHAFSKPCSPGSGGCDSAIVTVNIPPNLCCGAVAPILSK